MIWFVAPSLRGYAEKLSSGALTSGTAGTIVSSASELLAAAAQPDSVAFVDDEAIEQLSTCEMLPTALFAVTTANLAKTIPWLGHSWVSHVVSASMLDHALAASHLANVCTTLANRHPRVLDWIGPEVDGRRVRLTHASRRDERLGKMSAFLAEKGVGERTIQQLRDAAEELLTNAFYDAPVAAGAFERPVSRETDVVLPEESACDLAYGARDDLAIVRIKDPFGSLSRRRLVEVLTRCSRPDGQVQIDESMGGAGLGMWKIFSTATFVAVSVIKRMQTEILVGISTKRSNPKPFAFDLFFTDGHKPKSWTLVHDQSVNPSLSKSMLLELDSKAME